jgi:hypothetical protein
MKSRHKINPDGFVYYCFRPKDGIMTAEAGLKWLLRFIAVTAIPAFVAAVMPQSWLVSMVNKAEPGTSTGILVTYLVRILMAAYVLIGLECLVFSTDVRRYRPLIWLLGIVTLIIASVGLVVLFSAVPADHRVGFFWFVFVDFAEGLAQAVLLIILLLRIPIAGH